MALEFRKLLLPCILPTSCFISSLLPHNSTNRMIQMLFLMALPLLFRSFILSYYLWIFKNLCMPSVCHILWCIQFVLSLTTWAHWLVNATLEMLIADYSYDPLGALWSAGSISIFGGRLTCTLIIQFEWSGP